MNECLRRFQAQVGIPVQGQITDFLRSLIEKGELEVDERLPTSRELGTLWGTNHFTVQAGVAPLVDEGLVVRRRRLGTIVKGRPSQLSAVALFHSRPVDGIEHEPFYDLLNMALQEQLAEKGIGVHVLYDLRKADQRNVILPELEALTGQRRVQGILVSKSDLTSQAWLNKTGIPVSSIRDELPRDTGSGAKLAQLAARRLAMRGCRSVGYLSHALDSDDTQQRAGRVGELVVDTFLAEAELLGLECRPNWTITPEESISSLEQFGYENFVRFWQQEERPEGLFIYPDSVAKGCFQAIHALKVKVPEDLHLVVHRNQELDMFFPYPVDWVVVRIAEFARSLVDRLRKQVLGRGRISSIEPFEVNY